MTIPPPPKLKLQGIAEQTTCSQYQIERPNIRGYIIGEWIKHTKNVRYAEWMDENEYQLKIDPFRGKHFTKMSNQHIVQVRKQKFMQWLRKSEWQTKMITNNVHPELQRYFPIEQIQLSKPEKTEEELLIDLLECVLDENYALSGPKAKHHISPELRDDIEAHLKTLKGEE